jgi:hypothetical protein
MAGFLVGDEQFQPFPHLGGVVGEKTIHSVFDGLGKMADLRGNGGNPERGVFQPAQIAFGAVELVVAQRGQAYIKILSGEMHRIFEDGSPMIDNLHVLAIAEEVGEVLQILSEIGADDKFDILVILAYWVDYLIKQAQVLAMRPAAYPADAQSADLASLFGRLVPQIEVYRVGHDVDVLAIIRV